MIDLATISCAPLNVETEPTFIAGSESRCPDSWSGMYVAPSQSYRVMRLRWEEATAVGAAALRRVLVDTAGGARQVVYTPPTDPAGLALGTPRPSQQETIVGRLRGPFSLTQRGYTGYTLEAFLEEDH